MLINQLFESNKLQQDKPKTRNPVAKNAPRSGAGAHANKKRADRQGEVKHKKTAEVNHELNEMQHRPEQAVMILRRIPEGYRGARLYEKIMNTIIKRLGPTGSSSERREFYQTLAADVMERYVQKYPASAEVREDRASDEHRKAQVRLSDAIDRMIVKLEAAKNYQAAGRGEEAQRTISDAMSMFADAFERKLSREKYEDFIVPLDWCLDALANETWDAAVVNQTIDISISLLDEMNDRIWREIVPAKDDDEGGISVGDLSENYDEYANCYLSEGISEAMGLYGPFTVTINTGERPKSRTKTKKFRREDDAILWAENWLADAPQYVFATAEVTDPNGYVVWTTDESLEEQGVAEGLNEMDKSAPQPGRDGKVSHSTYGSRDKKGSDNFKGKEAPGKPITKKQMEKDALDILKKQGVAEGSVTESGETYVWTAHFGDGSTQQLRIATDEVPYARAAFEKKFPNKELTKVDTDWKPQDDGYGAMPASRYTEPRARPDNPMVRESDKDNFTIDDIKHLETINDFATLKAQAKELIKGKPARRMKPEKIAYFYNAVDKKSKPIEIIKLMYDLLLAGEGHQTIGSRHSTNPNTYRQKFSESTLNEAWSLLGQKSKGNLKVKIYKDKAWDRYAVEFYKGSYYDPRENFYTDDKQSAIEEIQRFFSYGGHGIGESSQVHGQETAKKISPVLTRPSKKHPFNGRLVGEDQHHDRKENIESSLVRRIKSKHMDQLTDALQKFGIEHVMQTISNTVDDYATIDELGSSDISIMVKQILKQWSRNVQ